MATFAIFIWPVIAVVLFTALGPVRGLVWSVTLGFLFLPEGWSFDLPLLPPYGKYETISVGALLGVLASRNRIEARPGADPLVTWVIGGFLALYFLSPFVTMLNNRDPLFLGPRVLPGIEYWDVQSQIIRTLILLVPFLVARRLLHSPEAHRELLKALAITAFFYSFLALYELRMSPQLNNIVYGYFPHAWIQHIRGGGWRPLVFLSHGLDLGFFLLTAVLAAAGLARSSGREQKALYIAIMLFVFAVLAVSRNLGALAICLILLPVALTMRPRMHLLIALVTAVLFTTYPIVRDTYIGPLLTVSERISADRHQSLEFRFDNEDLLMDRAAERPLAGWGPWGRWHVHDEETGRVLTISDGQWIIQLGEWGWLGFVALFGLVFSSLFLMRRAMRLTPATQVTSALVLMVTAHIIYMIPNATLTPLCWLVAGALTGFVQFAPGRAGLTRGRGRPEHQYSRFAPRERLAGAPDGADAVKLTRFGSGA